MHARPLEIAVRRFGVVHSVALTSFFSFFCGSCEKKIVWKLVCTWPIRNQTAAETLRRNVLCADTKMHMWVTVDLFVNVSTKLCKHFWSLAQPLVWSAIDPALRATELQQNQTSWALSSSVQGKDASSWRLICEWVCTVTSVSVRIEKRAKCAKLISQIWRIIFSKRQALSRALVVNSNLQHGKSLARG